MLSNCSVRKIKKRILYIKEFGLVFFVKTIVSIKMKEKTYFYDLIKEKLKETCLQTLEKYANNDEIVKKPETAEKVIWFFWWQGIENAPEIVKYCHRSVVANSGDYQVLLIDKSNYLEYIKLPPIIIERFDAGNISTTHLSDVVRMYLLRDYGGIWMDATSYLSDTVPNEYSQSVLISIKKKNNRFVPEGKWVIGLLATDIKHMVLFDYMCDAYEEYFKKHKMVIDYFLTDYLISIAYDNILAVRDIIDKIPENNTTSRLLNANINEPYDEEKWNEICKGTWFHSLTWKKEFVKESDGKDTFYRKIVCKYENAKGNEKNKY